MSIYLLMLFAVVVFTGAVYFVCAWGIPTSRATAANAAAVAFVLVSGLMIALKKHESTMIAERAIAVRPLPATAVDWVTPRQTQPRYK